jgi:hypothetical protein
VRHSSELPMGCWQLVQPNWSEPFVRPQNNQKDLSCFLTNSYFVANRGKRSKIDDNSAMNFSGFVKDSCLTTF